MNPSLESLMQLKRREFLGRSGLCLGAAALATLLDGGANAAEIAAASVSSKGSSGSAVDPLARRKPHFTARAKHVIYLHMIGGPSQLDLFENKPELIKRDGEKCPEELTKGKRFAFIGDNLTLSGSTFKFQKHGKGGIELSELLPNLARVADKICVLKSVHTEEINHAPAQMFLHTGFGRGNRPSVGSWVTYGLGSESTDLPAYVVLLSGPLGGAGTSLWSAGFLPSVYQGIQFRSSGDAVLFLSNPEGVDGADRRRLLDAVGKLNRERLATVGDPEIATRISQYEMAFRMQSSVPELMDIQGETAETLELYGATPGKASFANNCLLARRLIERGSRIVELYDADWDHHNSISTRLPAKTKDVDRAMAGLVEDLSRRGLLDETLVVWGAEFGRTPLRQGADGEGMATKPGRDHHKDAYCMWLAGGGVKGGVTYGQTDDFGFNVVDQGVHVHDLNATILHLLGLDHERLTYKYQGREFRLTDVEGHVLDKILA
jgi:hypothetical protein